MSAHSFTVFLDNPLPQLAKPRASGFTDTSLLRLSPSTQNNNTDNNLPGSAAKENLDPVTGQRPESTTTATNKKRKNSISNVLATKVHNPPTSKKQKESSSSKLKLDTKKRKPSTTSKPKSGSSADKDTKRTGSTSGKKSSGSSRSSKASSRKVSPMPKLDEEGSVLEEERQRIRQALIDSRCYELTVLPLADVTQAYDTTPSMEYPPRQEKPVFSRSVKEKSVELELSDYYIPSLSSSTSMPSLTHSTSGSSSSSIRASSIPPGLVETRTFSTPERKQIYAAFTFTSPSPMSERLGLSKSTSVDSIQFHEDT